MKKLMNSNRKQLLFILLLSSLPGNSSIVLADDLVWGPLRLLTPEQVARQLMYVYKHGLTRRPPIPPIPPIPTGIGLGSIAVGAAVGAVCAGSMYYLQCLACSDPEQGEFYCAGIRNIQAEGLDTMRF
jgi:hypothetical protein